MVRWWVLVVALVTLVGASREDSRTLSRTICNDESCRCHTFTRIICNCTRDYDEVTFRPNGSYRVDSTATSIIVDGCARVYFMSETLSGLSQMRSIELYNVQHVYFNELSVSWSPYAKEYELSNPGLRIIINNSTINDIASHTFKGRVDEFLISNSRINIIRPFAFSSLNGVKVIRLDNNTYDNIEAQAFKTFSTEKFIMKDGKINYMPSRMLKNLEVTDLLRIEGVDIGHIASSAFLVRGPKRTVIERNTIDTIESDAFHIVTRGPILFRNNAVRDLKTGAFLGFSADRGIVNYNGLQDFLIDNNTITVSSPSSFLNNRTSYALRIEALNINESCDCSQAEVWHSILTTMESSIMCYYPLEDHFISLPTYVESRCGKFKQKFWIFIVIAVIICFVIGTVVVFFVVRRENEKKKKLQIVMPDGKTYRETELHIIVERAELLTTDL